MEYCLYSCSLCKTVTRTRVLYQCSQCSFDICIPCARKPLIFQQTKAHEHELHQLLIEVSFTCDACGLPDTEYPCFCLKCCFIIHRPCIHLPRVICINRHDHRISHVSSLGPEKWICRVCYDRVNGDYGAYFCSDCLFVVHSKCALMDTIWDGRELEGVPEEEEEEESKPFQEIDQNLIKHFSHEHNLKVSFSSLGLEESREHCYACTLTLYSELCYKCTRCSFILHETCANLPLKKRHEISTRKLTLCYKSQDNINFGNLFSCAACKRYCTVFFYYDDYSHISIDVLCASISDAFEHESHPHWLFVHSVDQQISTMRAWCEGCDEYIGWPFLCCKRKDDCGGFNLCFTCATLRHKYDDHPVSLCYGEKNVNATYCCGICEEQLYSEGGHYKKETYSKSWCYKCDECGSTLHTKCVFRHLTHILSRYTLDRGGLFYLLPNNHLSRPICNLCETRCVGNFVLKSKLETNICICYSCGFPKKKSVKLLCLE